MLHTGGKLSEPEDEPIDKSTDAMDAQAPRQDPLTSGDFKAQTQKVLHNSFTTKAATSGSSIREVSSGHFSTLQPTIRPINSTTDVSSKAPAGKKRKVLRINS